MKIATINVIEISGDGLVFSLVSFPDNEEGSKAAEALFLEIVKETLDVRVWVAGECAALLDDGYCKVPGGGTIQLVHST